MSAGSAQDLRLVIEQDKPRPWKSLVDFLEMGLFVLEDEHIAEQGKQADSWPRRTGRSTGPKRSLAP
jgi:hypothetical protein